MNMDEIQGVQYEGILAKGYGLIPQLLTRDKDLSIEAKAIYGYLAAFAGTTGQAFPGVVLICAELNISKKRYLSHRKALIDKGYIEIKRERLENGFSKNLYILKQNIPYGVDSLPYDSLPYQNVGLQGVTVQNDPTISNSIKSNSINNNKEINNQHHHKGDDDSSLNSFSFYENNIGQISGFIAEQMDHMINESSEEMVLAALKVTVLNNAKNLKYTQTVLNNWAKDNITTLEQLESANNRKENGYAKNRSQTSREYDDGVNF